MNDQEKLYTLLTDANEDCTSFWDAVWEMAPLGDATDAEARYVPAIPEAQRLMRELLLSGLICVYRGVGWSVAGSNAREQEVTREEAEAIIADPESWRFPSDEDDGTGVYFCFYRTEAGRQLWYKGEDGFRLPGHVP